MKKAFIHICLIAGLLLPALRTPAQDAARPEPVLRDGSFLRQLQERDSILIGDQLQYGFRLENLAAGTRFALPDFSEKGLRDSVLLVRNWVVDTTLTKDGRMDLEASIVITSFDQGLYELPPLGIVTMTPGAAPDTVYFIPKVLDVRTLPVDPETYQPHDIRPQIRYPLTLREVLPYIFGIQLAFLLTVLAVCLIRQYRRRGSAEDRPKDPAHIVALRKLDRYRGSQYWAPEKQKAFHSGVTDALREYMADRYGVSALERTTAEIFDDLKQTDIPKDLYDEMKQLFEVSDFVKFAKLTVPDEDNAKVVPAAVRFVTSTYQTEIDEEADHVL